MNELLFLLSVLIYFSLMLVFYKFFGKVGIYCWTAISIVISNIEVLKMVDMFGMTATLGNVVYASSFLATDILSERYGKDAAKHTVNIGFITMLTFTIVTQLMMAFSPNSQDFANDAMTTLFGFTPRLALGSLVSYFIVQRLDIWIYHFVWKKTGSNDKFLWLRNNASTCISQLADSAIFTLIAFLGVFDLPTVLGLIVTTYVLKFVVSILDTPFIYLAKKIKPREI